MTNPPVKPKIYHITHISNLDSIISTGCIEADARRVGQGGTHTSIGMTEIKRRRLFDIDVNCNPGTKVGEYVPFYFCYRSIMLYILYMGNHPDMTHYREGQVPILHLQLDMNTAIEWASKHEVRWAFSDRNAGGYLASFYNDIDDIAEIDWKAVEATDFRDFLVKEGKQAEFLIHDTCPWHLVEKIGVLNQGMRDRVNVLLKVSKHKPVVSIERNWYY